MPVRVVKRGGKKPYKIVEGSGRVRGSSTTKKKAVISAWKRNSAWKKKHR